MEILDDDINREKGIIIDANSNKKRLKEEKNDLIEIDSKYYETEKKSNEDLDNTRSNLYQEIEKIKELINLNEKENATSVLENSKLLIEDATNAGLNIKCFSDISMLDVFPKNN